MRAGVGFVYPPSCPLCGIGTEYVDDHGPPVVFCHECVDRLAPIQPHSCQRCHAPVGPFLETSQGCGYCRGERYSFERVFALGVYDKQLRAACLQAKTSGGSALSAGLAGLLCLRESAALEAAEFDIVVPVPYFWTQRFRQQHHPSFTMSETISRCLKVRLGRHILSKIRKTPAQTTLTGSQRRTNLRNAFRVHGKSSLTGRNLLLVDDVLTTGTTANEASKVLKQAGAGRIIVAVAARGIGQLPRKSG